MNSTCIFVIYAICYDAHIPAEFSGSGSSGRGRVGVVLSSVEE